MEHPSEPVTIKKDAVGGGIRRPSWWRRYWKNYLYIVPALAFMVALIYYTIAYTFYTGFFEWNGISADSQFIGLSNYIAIAKDPVFYIALKNTFIFMVLAVSIQMALGLFMALMLRGPLVKLKAVYKAIFFLPTVLAPAVIAFVFRRMYEANGELNQLLEGIGLGFLAQEWLADPHIALYSITAINIWQWTGFSFILYFAALTTMDESVIEAARIDGANSFQVTTRIIFPLLLPTHFSLIILGVIGALKTFDIVWLTTGGGPGHATEFLATYIYKKTILEYDAGYSSALSMILLTVALLLTAIQLRAYRQNH
jgi:raffinose/stachyose/melibiose transport system permease protein